MSRQNEYRERAENCADVIEAMVNSLKNRGFSSEQAVQMVSGMLGAAHVYMPFAEVVQENKAMH